MRLAKRKPNPNPVPNPSKRCWVNHDGAARGPLSEGCYVVSHKKEMG